MNRFSIATVAAFAITAPIAPANAEITDLEYVFVKADQNGDSMLSKGEVLLIAIEQFGIADADGDDMIEAEEAGDLATDAEFSDNDSNNDGSLSIEEMIEEKLADFANLDANSDGLLSFDELKAAYPQQ